MLSYLILISENIMASLKLSGINKVFPSGERALYNVNFEAADREFLVILGGESSGKSTILRLIAGLDDVSSGNIFIDGKDVTEAEPKDRELSMVFKNATLFPAMNVFDNMAMGLRQRKASEAVVEERVKVAAEILGLTDSLFRKPKALTSAEKQRASIGRAVVREPKLYLFDEPLAGLDEKLRADLLNTIINLHARMNATFVYSTKNLSEALTIGTRVVVMKDGFVQQIDTPANLYDYPANAYVAFLIGSPTVNFIYKTKIVREGDLYKAVFAGGEFVLLEKIAEYADSGKEVTLGVRPEDISISAGGALKAKAENGTNVGNGYCECKVSPALIMTVSCDKDCARGTEVGLEADLSRLLVFDTETGLTLLKRDKGYQPSGLPDADYIPLTLEEERAATRKFGVKKDQKKKR